jgi:hypothetical protein
MLKCRSLRVSKGVTLKLSITPLLTRRLLQFACFVEGKLTPNHEKKYEKEA